MTRLKPELWLNKLQQLCKTCSPKLTRLWPTAGLQRQLFTWKEKSSRHSAGLTIPPWMTVVWVSLACILSRLPHVCLSLTHFIFTPLLPWLNYRVYKLYTYSTFHCCLIPWFWPISTYTWTTYVVLNKVGVCLFHKYLQ